MRTVKEFRKTLNKGDKGVDKNVIDSGFIFIPYLISEPIGEVLSLTGGSRFSVANRYYTNEVDSRFYTII